MNESQAKPRRLLADPEVTTAVADHRDRLVEMTASGGPSSLRAGPGCRRRRVRAASTATEPAKPEGCRICGVRPDRPNRPRLVNQMDPRPFGATHRGGSPFR